jgi:Polyketide cyclase / dehydrase and lipid transport
VARFTLRESIAAPIDIVFDVLADHQGQADRTLLRSSTLERAGDPPPNGVGAVRRLSLVGPPIREQVTVFEPPHHFAYKMLSGVPVQSHVGTVELTRQGASTLLIWQIDSVPKFPVPAAVWSALVRPAIKVLLAGVKKKAEIRAQ